MNSRFALIHISYLNKNHKRKARDVFQAKTHHFSDHASIALHDLLATNPIFPVNLFCHISGTCFSVQFLLVMGHEL